MKPRSFLLVLILVCFQSISSFAQDFNYRLLSLYVYNFGKHIEWPVSHKNGEFVIGVYGDTPLYQEIVKTTNQKSKGTQPIIIRKIESIDMVKDCHILFVSKKESAKFKLIAETTKSTPVLIVTEQTGYARKGSCINIFLDEDDDNKTKYEINKTLVEGKGLKVSSDLLSLGVIVK
jgi:hypothetical protein